MHILEILIVLWVAAVLIPAIVASMKGRPFVGWLLYSLFLTPIAFIHALCLVNISGDESQLKKCPFCAEVVKLDAKLCKHCGSKLQFLGEEPATE